MYRSSALDLGAPSVNAHVEIAVPDNRWVLFAGGPRLGPSVMFWSTLAIVAGLAFLLGRLRFTPLRAQHWLLLGVGLTQAPFVASVPVVACLLLLGLRGREAERFRALGPVLFALLQGALAMLTAIAAGALVFAIQHGLLGTPEMRIAGNGSDSFALRWYLDRADSLLPAPWMFSLSIWWYRAAMLAWSMWLALALVQWARWGFAQWSAGGMLKPRRDP
jgi:5-carboxymethyl-2-hydroxymuconate isomerase